MPPPLTGISGFHLSNFIMIVVIFSFFDLALGLVPPKFVFRRVPSMSEKCRLSFANPRFQFCRDPGTVSCVFLNYFSWKEGINSRLSSIINSLNLSPQDSVLRTEYQSFSVIHRPSARHALSRISRDSIFLMTGLCSDDIIGLAKMV